MSLEINFNHEPNNPIVKVALTGSLDTNTAPTLDQKLSSAFQPGFQLLIFDMKNLDYISSAGLRVIFKAAKQAKAKGGRIAVANRQPQIAKVFEIVKALPDLQVFTSDAEMDRYLQHIQTES